MATSRPCHSHELMLSKPLRVQKHREDGFAFVTFKSDWRSVEARQTTSSSKYPTTGIRATITATRAGGDTAKCVRQGAVMANTQSQGKSRPIRCLSRLCACSWVRLAQTTREQTRITLVQHLVRDACRPRNRLLEKRYRCPFSVLRSYSCFTERSLKNVHSLLLSSLGLPLPICTYGSSPSVYGPSLHPMD